MIEQHRVMVFVVIDLIIYWINMIPHMVIFNLI
jgi:hypothetical protein